jgi:hypothetical protein
MCAVYTLKVLQSPLSPLFLCQPFIPSIINQRFQNSGLLQGYFIGMYIDFNGFEVFTTIFVATATSLFDNGASGDSVFIN